MNVDLNSLRAIADEVVLENGLTWKVSVSEQDAADGWWVMACAENGASFSFLLSSGAGAADRLRRVLATFIESTRILRAQH